MFTTIACNRKSHRIVSALFGQARTGCGVTKIAKLPQLLRRWICAFVAGCAAVPRPSAAQGQARRMEPTPILQFAHRHEKWTSHSLKTPFEE
jgi:hypothetical protein